MAEKPKWVQDGEHVERVVLGNAVDEDGKQVSGTYRQRARGPDTKSAKAWWQLTFERPLGDAATVHVELMDYGEPATLEEAKERAERALGRCFNEARRARKGA